MKFTWITKGRCKGVIIGTQSRDFMFGFGYDSSRKWGLGTAKFPLVYSRGVTGNFGLGKVWLWYGTWRNV